MADEEDDNPFEEAGRQVRQAGRQARAWARNFKLRSVGDSLGEWAKKARDLVVEVSENVGVPEAVRDATEQARAMRLAGDPAQARAMLRELIETYGSEPALVNALALTATHERFIEDRVPGGIEVLRELASRLDEKKVGAVGVLDAAEQLRGLGQPAKALDTLRRSKRNLERLSSQDLIEARLLSHLIAASAHRRLGEHERAIREIRKAAAALPPHAGEGMRRLTLALGVDQLLADGRVVEAERWVQTFYQRRLSEARRAAARSRAAQAQEQENPVVEPGAAIEEDVPTIDDANTEIEVDEPIDDRYTPLEQALLARVLAARGERKAARSLLGELSGERSELIEEARVRVLISVGEVDEACREALHFLQLDATRPDRLRLWALAELRRFRAVSHSGAEPQAGALSGVIDALLRALAMAPSHARTAQAQELAHVALLVEDFSQPVCRELDAVRREQKGDLQVLGAELRLHRIRAALREALAKGRGTDTLDLEVRRLFSEGPPFRLRARPELAELLGPDELSPLRDPLRREALVAAQRELAIAERTMLEGPQANAAVERALVAALVQDPDLPAARRRLAELTRPKVGDRLEDLLTAATELLAKLPDQVLGAPIHGGAEALRLVIAARERL
ncbi:MAG: hypothetical protein KC431_17445, partial [Myxococcales bacterium]|nr:hypothetical protein [Myxococcales bacterium]